MSFGRDFATITLKFTRESETGAVHDRQSQIWVRFEQGWRIVQAHVSALPTGEAPRRRLI